MAYAYVYVPYVLEDEGGQFTLSEERENLFAHHYRRKNYVAGLKEGKKSKLKKRI